MRRFKKALCAVLSALTVFSAAALPASAADRAAYPLAREEILIRDPFVLVYEGKYYMYGTGLASDGYGCTVSEDLEHWSRPQKVFDAPEGFDGCDQWWAPECHYYNGSFYLFATYRSRASDKRGTAVFRADAPTGPFTPLSDGHITPKYRDCIDGTLYVDEAGQPWIVYVGEWTSDPEGIGDMFAAKLSRDLSRMVSEPIALFRGVDAPWAVGRITDGPFVYRTETGDLLVLWSNSGKGGYTVGIARSSDGTFTGKWRQRALPLYQKDRRHALDGGHGMIFTDLNGRRLLSIHSPNDSGEGYFEHAVFLPVEDLGFTLALEPEEPSPLFKYGAALTRQIYSRFSRLRNTLIALFRAGS